MTRRSEDAQENLSRWESLLSDADDSLGRTRHLAESIQSSMNDIELTWEETASDVETARTDVEKMTEHLRADRESVVTFEESEAANLPPPVESDKSVHGAPDRPDEATYELTDSVSEREVERHLESVEEKPPEGAEKPEPFTEQSWFELHSDQFPIGEEVFTEEALARDLESEDEEPDTGGDEQTEQPTREDESEDARETR